MQRPVDSPQQLIRANAVSRTSPRNSRGFLFLMFCVGLLLVGPTVFAAETPLDAIPENASVVIRLKSPQTTIGKVAEFVNQAQPGFGDLVKAQASAIGLLISNPPLAGVDQKKDWWVAVFASAESEPGIAFAIPATDAEAMKGALGNGFEFATVDDWVIYTQDESTAKSIQTRIGGEGKSLKTLIDKRSQAAFDSGDISAYVNVKQLTKTYQAQLNSAADKIDETLGQITELVPETPGFNLGAIFDMYGRLAKNLLQGVKDSEGFTLAIAFNQQSISIEEYVKVAADSATDKFFQSHAAADLKLLNKLPGDQLGYFGFHGNMEGLTDWAINLSLSMFGSEDDAKAKELKAAVSEMKQVKFGSYVGSFSLGKLEEGVIQGSVIVEATPTDKVKGLYRRMSRAMGTFEIGGLKQEYQLTTDAETFGEAKADVLRMKQEVDENLDPTGMQKKILEAMYGPGGMTSRIVYLKDLVLQAIGSNKQVMTDLLQAINSESTTDNKARQSVRQELTPKANLIGLIDLPGIVHRALTIVVNSEEVPIPIPPEVVANLKVALQQIKVESSFIGFCVATEPQALHCKTVVPLQQIQGFVRLAIFIRSMAQGQR